MQSGSSWKLCRQPKSDEVAPGPLQKLVSRKPTHPPTNAVGWEGKLLLLLFYFPNQAKLAEYSLQQEPWMQRSLGNSILRLADLIIQTNLWNIAGLVPDQHNKVSHTNVLVSQCIQNLCLALPRWLSWFEHHPVHQKAGGWIPCQGAYLGCGPIPGGHTHMGGNWWVFLSL